MPKKLIVALSGLFFSEAAFSYIGPGIAVGTIATLLGLVGSFFLLLLGIVYYPLKRFIKKLSQKIADRSP
jgi:hypothetical protein